ncbi:MAG: lytic transglycosylase domain-containing protein [Candidatus Binataceae bacterium]
MGPVDSRATKRGERRGRAGAVAAIAALLALVSSSPSRANEVRVPVTIDYVTLSEALRHAVYTAPGGRAALWNGSDDCQFLYAENPVFSRADARVKLETTTSLGLGVQIAGQCVSPLNWGGIVEAESSPYVATGLRLMLRIEEMNLYDQQHQKTLIAGKGFDLIKQYLIPRIETFSYDLNPSIQQLAMLAEAASTPTVADRIRNAIATTRADPAVAAQDDGVKISLIITVPDVPAPAASATSGEPTPEELQAFQEQLDQWDAFLVFAIKHLGVAGGDKQFRDDLLQILLDSRYRLVQALGKPPSAAGPDPVRILFLDTWQKLGTAVRSAAQRGQLGSRALEFLSFISAGDALFALDQAAPALGMRISAADLRQLAHIMAPDATGDPLQFNFAEDPALKSLFGPPGAPLSSPPESTPVQSPTAQATATAAPPSPTPTPATSTAVPSSTSTPAADASQASRWLRFPLWLIEPADACAAETEQIVPQLKEVATRLRKIVVAPDNADGYRGDVERLLELSTDRQLRDSSLDSRYQPTFRLLVKSAAWQESCWRQFVRRGDRVTWLESSTGDIGLMQVNKYVWRGFYDIEKLKWDVLYNAGAGTEILMELTQRVLTKPHSDPVRFDTLALSRSVYAAYNGGPDAYNRWRRLREQSPAREIDAAFLEKYHAIERGQAIDILSCAAQWGD